MLNTTLLAGFIAASLVVLVLPGPGVLYVVARSLAQGRRAGLVSALGLAVGVFAHVAAAAVGLSALLLASANAFEAVRLLGAGYLVYLGITALRARPRIAAPGAGVPPPLPLRRLFRDGVVVSVLNPKIAAFFVAFLPQFVDASLGAVPLQILVLGALYAALALVTDGGYALLAGGLRARVGRWACGPWPDRLGGGVMVGLGTHMALAGRGD